MASTSSVNPTVSCSISLSSSETEPPSKQASPDSALWDVFLSFRGPDTRLKFTNHLYNVLDIHGLQTFRDKPELQPGDPITESLIEAIQNSKTYVVVFSKDYASSPWCLDELVEIYKCYQENNRLVIGVYYHIDPSDVRHQKESFKDAFEKHITGRYLDKIDHVNRWRRALKGVADFSGLPISATSDADDVDIINEIGRLILQHVKPKTLHVADHFVARGILQDIEIRITSWLSSETVKGGVIKIGLHGLGGVGKTTLAKALYNHVLKFSSDFKASCCFLADVREVYGRPNGLVSLQNQLISAFVRSKTKDHEVHNDAQGTKYISTRFGLTKVLLIIDDVDHIEQCKSLMGPYADGSVVIITTRDTTILDKIQVEPSQRYEVSVMNDAESLKLFTAHAFSNDAKPSEDLVKLSNDVLRHAGKLPLALVVFGSHLFDESKQGWIEFIDQLQLYPVDGVEEKLVISYDALKKVHPKLQDIFLDVACFFVGWDKESAVKIMETCYTSSNYYIQILKKKSLLSINNRNQLEMHGLLGKMGKQIARNKFPHDKPEKHTRLWELEDIHKVLLKQKGTDSIQGIIPSNFNYLDRLAGVKLPATTFQNMSRLRFLYIKDVELTGSFEDTFEDLTWFRWDCCLLTELPSHFCPERLVVLELHDGNIIKWELNKVFEKLKTLDMSNSINLTTVPDLAKLPNLETLNLEGCKNLEKVDIPDDSLTKLVSFKLSGCVKLTNIQVIGSSSMRVLEVLDVSRCEKLETLPHQLWEITSLRKIYFGTRHLYLEAPFKHLNLSRNNFTALPSFYSHFLKLEHLDLFHWPKLLSIEQLPPNLKKLRLRGCRSLVRLPNLLSLTQLEHLEIENCIALTEIQGLEECTSLRHLDLNRCNESLHANILTTPYFQVLEKLKTLDMSYSRYLTEMSDFTMLPSLESLEFMRCPGLEKVLISAKSLTQLVSCDLSGCLTLKEIHISNESLLKLVSFNLSFCVELRSIHIGSSSFSQLLSLKYLNLDKCRKLSSIEQLPPNLKELHLDSCESLESLPNLSSLTQLEVLDITCCRGLTEIKGLEELTSIYDLGLNLCKSTLQTNILTESFFQIYSGLKHMVRISAGQFPNWFKSDLCTEYDYTYMIPKCGLDILGVIICLDNDLMDSYECDVENVTSGESYELSLPDASAVYMIILPRSIFSAKEGDELHVRSNGYIVGIHLVYDE